jgi:hypothetical protein
MLAQLTRRTIALTLVLAPLASLAVPGISAAAGRHEPALHTGVFDGVWHTDKVQIIITKIHRDGTFLGELRFDPCGRWGDVRTGLTGKVGPNDSISVTRDDCAQTARTGGPEWRGRALVWRGEVTGQDFTSNFELCVPRGR